jgi:hypothetical protein
LGSLGVRAFLGVLVGGVVNREGASEPFDRRFPRAVTALRELDIEFLSVAE